MPTVTVHRKPLDSFIERQYNIGQGTTPSPTPPGLCLLSGQIVQRNLKRKLTQRNIPPSSIADYVTIEDIGSQLLESSAERPVVEIDDDFRQRLEASALSEAEEGELGDDLESFANRIAWHDEETLEELDNELSDYLRATDSAADHSNLVEVAEASTNQFVREDMPTRLDVFRDLADILSHRLDQDDLDLYPTRSHLVSAAKAVVGEHWEPVFGSREWFAVSTLNVLDNTTLKLILEIARLEDGPDIHFFFQNGTYSRQVARLNALIGEENVDTPDDDTITQDYLDGRAAETLINAVQGEEFDTPNTLRFIEAPERRREAERVVELIREQLSHGTDPVDIIVVARDVGKYKSILEDIFETNEIPYHVETPRPFAHVPAYRFLKATIDLLAAANRGEALDYHQITDPLRLGFCYPHRRSSAWPMDDRKFLYLEQRLHNYQDRNDGENFDFDDWNEFVESREGWDYAWELMEEYLEWIRQRISDPPEDGTQIRGLMRELLREYVFQRIPDRRGIPGGPGIEPTRTNLGHPHPSSTGQRILNQADAVGRHYDFSLDILDNEPSWDETARAIGEVIGSGTYGVSNNDGQAIRILDAGNTYFLDASVMYFLGLASGEFPVDSESPSFIHDELRNDVTRLSAQGTQPELHLNSRLSQYEVDLDIYETTLRASTGEISLLHRYKDADRNQINWSPFVDLLPTDQLQNRVRADEWLPERDEHETWEAISERIAEKDRIRLLYHHSHRPHPNTWPSITAGDITDIASHTAQDQVVESIIPRYDRYARPPTSIEVTGDEPAFVGNNLDLNDVIGGPIRTHEADLLSHCQLKYYFYQLLFNYQGEDVLRDEIPFYRGGEPDYRLGELPHAIRHNYTEDRYAEQWESIIEHHLQDRQTALDAFDSIDELERWFEESDDFTEWDQNSLLPVLIDEWELVQAELDAGIERDWDWQEGQDLEISDDVDLLLRQPGHRRDAFPQDDDYGLPIFFIRNTSYGQKAIKRCWQYDGDHQAQSSHAVCRTCGNLESCTYPTKYVLDHRFHSVVAEGSDLVGIQYQERFDSRSRRGHLKNNHVEGVRGGLVDDAEDDFGNDTFQAWLWHQVWRDQLQEESEAILTHLDVEGNGGSVQFDVNEEFVDAGGCVTCVYRDMCMVPQSRGRDW